MPKMSVNQSSHFNLREEDVIRLILEFLSNRELSISQMSVERETGLNNHVFSDDLLFLRQLILDGQWDDTLHFVQPLESIESFDKKRFKYLVNKHKYIELLCIRSEAGPIHNVEIAVNDVVDCLNHLEQLCPNKDDYNELCLLLTVPNLSEQKDYKNWNPSNWRITCFKAILPLIERYLPADKKTNSMARTAKGDRLMQLIIKGILYESCVEFCQQKATSSPALRSGQMKFSSLLEGKGFSNSDLSLISWLQSIPCDTFSHPFEQKALNVEVEQLEKPSLIASWSEVILVTPIKPKVFPHSATPFTRRKASDLMSKSLTPGIVDGLTKSVMNFSITDMTAMSRSSFATTGFHLNSTNGNEIAVNNSNNNNSAIKTGQTSVDRLFEEGDVFSSSCFQKLTPISEKPSPVSTVSMEDSKLLNEAINTIQRQTPIHPQSLNITPISAKDVIQSQNSSDLWQKFQKEKQKLLEKLLKEEEEMFLCGTAVPQVITNRENTFQSTYTNVIQTPIIYNEISQKVTPVGQTGQSNYPNPERLITSTPKGSLYRIHETPSFNPNESPIFAANNRQNGSQQKNISFNSSVNGLVTTNSNISSHQSSQQSHQLSAQSSELGESRDQQRVRKKSFS